MSDPTVRRAQIQAGLAAVRQRIDQACLVAGRADPVSLVVVTKTFPASDVMILRDLGVTEVAENRVQEAEAKHRDVPSAGADIPLRWHMIGQIQRNKAASVAAWADVVESVDRPELVAALGRAAVACARTLDVLVQIALDPAPRPGRGGIDPSAALDLAEAVDAEEGLTLRGVMGVAPFPGDPDDAFERLARVAAAIQDSWPQAGVVSAGMSGDLERAVVHGATQVRIGGAILGDRAYVQ